jgi:branched-chain amino acid transport system permease protein
MTRTAMAAAAGIAVLSFCVPLVIDADYTLQVLFRIYLFAALGLAWNLVGGYAGQLSLGHAAYFGAGAYGLALFSGAGGAPPWLAVLGGVAVAVACATVIGLISFRLRGPYFTLATIACADILRISAKNLTGITGGDVGVQVPALFAAPVSRNFYWAAVALLLLSFTATILVGRARFGYSLLAIRENEDTAASVGINAVGVKLGALVLSAMLTALAGALYGSLFLYIVPDQVLGHEISNQIAIVAMFGGAGTLLGPIVGAVVLETAAEVFKNVFQEAHLLIYGGLLIVVVLFLPEGIVGAVSRRLRARSNAAPAPEVRTGV